MQSLGCGCGPFAPHFRFFGETAPVAVDNEGDVKVFDWGLAPRKAPRIVEQAVDTGGESIIRLPTSNQLELIDRQGCDDASAALEPSFASPADHEAVSWPVGVEPNDFEPAVGAVSDVRQLLGEISQRVFVVFGDTTNLGRKAPDGTRLPMSLPVRHYYSRLKVPCLNRSHPQAVDRSF